VRSTPADNSAVIQRRWNFATREIPDDAKNVKRFKETGRADCVTTASSFDFGCRAILRSCRAAKERTARGGLQFCGGRNSKRARRYLRRKLLTRRRPMPPI